MTLDTQQQHDQSVKDFPNLNLGKDEYVIKAIDRHPIGLIPPLAIGLFLVILSLIVFFSADRIVGSMSLGAGAVDPMIVRVPVLTFALLVLIGTYIAYYVFKNNHFYLTNENVIEQLQISLFYTKEEIVSLPNIQDARYAQKGLIQQLFNFGSIRLSTEGDDTTYYFIYVANPKDQIALIDATIEEYVEAHPGSGH